MELKNIEQGEIEWVEVYYERIQKLTDGLQTLITNSFITIVFCARL